MPGGGPSDPSNPGSGGVDSFTRGFLYASGASGRGSTCLPLVDDASPDSTIRLYASDDGDAHIHLEPHRKYAVSLRYTLGTVDAVNISINDFIITTYGPVVSNDILPVFANLAKWYSFQNFLVFDMEGTIEVGLTPLAIKIACPKLVALHDGSPQATLSVVDYSKLEELPTITPIPHTDPSGDMTTFDMEGYMEVPTPSAEPSNITITGTGQIVQVKSYNKENQNISTGRWDYFPFNQDLLPSGLFFKKIMPATSNLGYQNATTNTLVIAMSGSWVFDVAPDQGAWNVASYYFNVLDGATVLGYTATENGTFGLRRGTLLIKLPPNSTFGLTAACQRAHWFQGFILLKDTASPTDSWDAAT